MKLIFEGKHIPLEGDEKGTAEMIAHDEANLRQVIKELQGARNSTVNFELVLKDFLDTFSLLFTKIEDDDGNVLLEIN